MLFRSDTDTDTDTDTSSYNKNLQNKKSSVKSVDKIFSKLNKDNCNSNSSSNSSFTTTYTSSDNDSVYLKDGRLLNKTLNMFNLPTTKDILNDKIFDQFLIKPKDLNPDLDVVFDSTIN